MDTYYVLCKDFSFIGNSVLVCMILNYSDLSLILFSSKLKMFVLLIKLCEWDACEYNWWYVWIPLYNDICCLWMWLVIWWMLLYNNICWSFCTSIWHDKVTGFEMAKYKFGINQIFFKVKHYVVKKSFVYLETNITSVPSVYRNGPRAYDEWNGPISRDIQAHLIERLYISRDASERPNIACHI